MKRGISYQLKLVNVTCSCSSLNFLQYKLYVVDNTTIVYWYFCYYKHFIFYLYGVHRLALQLPHIKSRARSPTDGAYTCIQELKVPDRYDSLMYISIAAVSYTHLDVYKRQLTFGATLHGVILGLSGINSSILFSLVAI